MAEYIDRDNFHIEICKRVNSPAIRNWLGAILAEIPTANLAPVVHGEWIEGKNLEKCSLCGKKGFPDWKYCPSCGAKMDGRPT